MPNLFICVCVEILHKKIQFDIWHLDDRFENTVHSTVLVCLIAVLYDIHARVGVIGQESGVQVLVLY